MPVCYSLNSELTKWLPDWDSLNQGWECAFLLKISLFKEPPWGICSRSSLKKSDREKIALIALYKRVTRANHFLTKSDMTDLLIFWEQITLLLSKNEWFTQHFFLHVFYSFSLLFLILCPRVKCSRRLAPSLFFKEQWERFALRKECIVICSFAHIKRMIHLKNQTVNSQPWSYGHKYSLCFKHKKLIKKELTYCLSWVLATQKQMFSMQKINVSEALQPCYNVCRVLSHCHTLYPGQGWEFAHSFIAHELICSNGSGQMSECERFTRVAQDKWVTVSKLLRLLMTNEGMWAICSGRSGQMSEWANPWVFLSKSLIFLFCSQKWAIC